MNFVLIHLVCLFTFLIASLNTLEANAFRPLPASSLLLFAEHPQNLRDHETAEFIKKIHDLSFLGEEGNLEISKKKHMPVALTAWEF